jgi:hypothetical protein
MQSTKPKPVERILKDGYYQISVKLEDGFRFKIPARGFNLKSLLEFEQSLDSVTEHSFKEITLKEYDKMIHGTPQEEKQVRKKGVGR